MGERVELVWVGRFLIPFAFKLDQQTKNGARGFIVIVDSYAMWCEDVFVASSCLKFLGEHRSLFSHIGVTHHVIGDKYAKGKLMLWVAKRNTRIL